MLVVLKALLIADSFTEPQQITLLPKGQGQRTKIQRHGYSSSQQVLRATTTLSPWTSQPHVKTTQWNQEGQVIKPF